MSGNHNRSDGIDELHRRFQHLQRVTRRESVIRMRHHEYDDESPSKSQQPRKLKVTRSIYSSEELKRLQKCFLSADHDKDGKLNGLELSYWLEKHNCPLGRIQLGQVLKNFDLDKDGALDWGEFVRFCEKIGLQEDKNKRTQEEEETFYDCLEDPAGPVDTVLSSRVEVEASNKERVRLSLHALKEGGLAKGGLKVFEEQIQKCNGTGGYGQCENIVKARQEIVKSSHAAEEPNRKVEESSQEKKKYSNNNFAEDMQSVFGNGFDFEQLRGVLHHPRDEGGRHICEDQMSSSRDKNRNDDHYYNHQDLQSDDRLSIHDHMHDHRHEHDTYQRDHDGHLCDHDHQHGHDDYQHGQDDYQHGHDDHQHGHDKEANEENRFRTELFITPHHADHNNENETTNRDTEDDPHSATSISLDDTRIIVPVDPSSSDRFDSTDLRKSVVREEVSNRHDLDETEINHSAHLAQDVDLGKENEGVVVVGVKKEQQRHPPHHRPSMEPEAYQHFYGTHPGPDLEEDFEGLQLAERGWDKDPKHWKL